MIKAKDIHQEKIEGRVKVQKMIDDAIASGVSEHSLDDIFDIAKHRAKESDLSRHL